MNIPQIINDQKINDHDQLKINLRFVKLVSLAQNEKKATHRPSQS